MKEHVCCPNCGNRELSERQEPCKGFSRLLGKKRRLFCGACGTEFIAPEVLQEKIDNAEKRIPTLFFLFSLLLWLLTAVLFAYVGANQTSLWIVLGTAVLVGIVLFVLFRRFVRKQKRRLQELRRKIESFAEIPPEEGKKRTASTKRKTL